VLRQLARDSDLILCAWGTHGAHLDRGPAVAAKLRAEGHALHHLALCQGGAPKHPLYLPYDLAPRPWP
jgi:hypothetical protein